MRIILAVAAVTTLGLLIGLNWPWWPSLVTGLIAGILVETKFGAGTQGTHRVIVEDLATGKQTIQPMDRATVKYIDSRATRD